VATDPKSGDVLVMVGSRDYFDKEIDGNFNVAIGKRQPGSAFKPFVYATALKKGYTPQTVLFDVRTEFSTECNADGTPMSAGRAGRCYRPENYDNQYRGPVTLKNALAQSLNVPAVKALYLVGVRDAIETARDFGITTLTNPDQYGLTLVLGSGEVSLLELTSAYGVFAAKGIRHQTQTILSVKDPSGAELMSAPTTPRRVIEERVALEITDMLSDNAARAPAFGQNSLLRIPGKDVAVKTGTTNNYQDAWIVGYSPNLSVGAWAGNNDNRAMERRVAGFIIAPLWNEFISLVLAELPEERFQPPPHRDTSELKPIIRGIWQGGERYIIDVISGKLATEYTPPELREERFVPAVHSILHWVDKRNPTGPPLANPANDAQYRLWEYPVALWAATNGYSGIPATKPTEYDDIHLPENRPIPVVSGIIPATVYDENTRITIQVSGHGRFPIEHAEYYINGKYAGVSAQAPFTFSFVPRFVEGIRPENEIRVVVQDSVKNRGESVTPFLVRITD
jgi:membrane peptidoglycan carboxypeptidase